MVEKRDFAEWIRLNKYRAYIHSGLTWTKSERTVLPKHLDFADIRWDEKMDHGGGCCKKTEEVTKCDVIQVEGRSIQKLFLSTRTRLFSFHTHYITLIFENSTV